MICSLSSIIRCDLESSHDQSVIAALYGTGDAPSDCDIRHSRGTHCAVEGLHIRKNAIFSSHEIAISGIQNPLPMCS